MDDQKVSKGIYLFLDQEKNRVEAMQFISVKQKKIIEARLLFSKNMGAFFNQKNAFLKKFSGQITFKEAEKNLLRRF